MPDLAVCLTSALEGKAQLAVGDVLGSNIFDILLVTGVVALVVPGPLKRQAWHFDVPVLLLSSVALFIVADDKIIDNTPDNIINRTDGLLLLVFCTFMRRHRLTRLQGVILVAGYVAYAAYLILTALHR